MKITLQRKSLGIIGTVGVPAKYGGFETLVHHLVQNLSDRFDITVYSSSKAYTKEEQVEEWEGAKIKYIPLKANGYQSVFYDAWSMIHALYTCQTLLVLGVSAGIFIPIFKLFFPKKRIVVNIDGLEWRRPKWSWFAKMFLLLNERIACRFADEIITDNRILKEYAKIRYNVEGCLIEYGADHTQARRVEDEDLEKFPFLANEYAFTVARIEPENNIHLILDAFARYPEQMMVVVGNWDNSKYGKDLRAYYQQFDHLKLLDPIYDIKQLDVLRSNAHYYVHGHSAGGTNPSLVEAMYLRLPVIAFDAIFNRVTTNNQAIFYNTADELFEVISNIDRYPLYAVAENLKTIANKKYTWKNISERYAHVIEGTEAEPVYIPQLQEHVNLSVSQKQQPLRKTAT